MGEKSSQKKKYIIEAARKVFVEKGFARVTMKDIVEACDISRGGLYLYFNNTDEVFLEVLRQEQASVKDVFADMEDDATAADILILFFKEQKKEILSGQDALAQATYEFYFKRKLPKRDDVVRRRFDSYTRILQRLLEAGVENGEFRCSDCAGCASNIMYTLEGLKIMSQAIGVTSELVDRQIFYFLKNLGVA